MPSTSARAQISELEKVRWAHGLTVSQVSTKTGLPRATIANAEAGLRITPKTAKALAEVYGLSIEEIRLKFHGGSPPPVDDDDPASALAA